MLVLTRKEGEALLLGDDIEIRVVRIDGEHVRLGIVAPKSVRILRTELLADIRDENGAAAIPEPASVKDLLRMLTPLPADKS